MIRRVIVRGLDAFAIYWSRLHESHESLRTNSQIDPWEWNRNMLILSRRESERICLGDDIVLTIVRVNGDKVRIGIEAPANVKILRNELENIRELPAAKPQDPTIPRKSA